jgi:hypothetical protein
VPLGNLAQEGLALLHLALQGQALPLAAVHLQGLQHQVQARKVLVLRALADLAKARAVQWP